MSGGRKSAIAASILLKQGYQVVAAHFTKRQTSVFPCTQDGTAKVKELAHKMGIDVHYVDIADQYQAEVEEKFLHERAAGLASNPCLVCQGKLTFEPLIATADRLKINWIATGHGAQVIHNHDGGRVSLYQAMDLTVDESELLIGVRQDVLKRLILPLGTLNQAMLFKLAVQFELTEHDSTDRTFSRTAPCFDPYSDTAQKWLTSHLPQEFTKKGIIRTAEQEIVGAHDGLFRYPLGLEARDLKIESETSKNLVVESFDAKSYEVRIGPKALLMKKGFVLKDVAWIVPADELKFNAVTIKFQSRKEVFAGEMISFEGNRARLILSSPVNEVLLGESVAIYDKQELLGGAVVEAYESSDII